MVEAVLMRGKVPGKGTSAVQVILSFALQMTKGTTNVVPSEQPERWCADFEIVCNKAGSE